MLFPYIESIAPLEGKLNKLQSDVSEIRQLQVELKKLIEDTTKKSFDLKGSGYEVCDWLIV